MRWHILMLIVLCERIFVLGVYGLLDVSLVRAFLSETGSGNLLLIVIGF